MEIKSVRLADIFPYYNNPRDNAKAVAPTMESIKRYGFVKPIICDKDGVIICGHTRYIAAFQLGLEYVPVIFSDMPEEKSKEFRIADNKLAEKSVYDENALIEELKGLEVPESMQAFFFEDVSAMINFDFNADSPFGQEPINMSKPSYEMSMYEDEQYPQESESQSNGNDTYTEESVKVISVGEEEGVNIESSHENDLFVPYRKDGKLLMNVICPFCGNKETVEYNKF